MNKKVIYLLLGVFLLVACHSKSNERVESNTDNHSQMDDEQDFEDLITTETDISVVSYYYLKGSVDDKYTFLMQIEVDSNHIKGYYRYNNQKKNINLKGKLEGNKFYAQEEKTPENFFTGIFDYQTGVIAGTWTSKDRGQMFPFEIKNYYETGFPQHTFKTNLVKEVSESGYVFHTITELYVYDETGKTKEYTLSGFESTPFESSYRLEMGDYNFDGYPDIGLMEFMPSYPPVKFIFWLYNPYNERYEQTDLLEDVYSLPNISYGDSTAHVSNEGNPYTYNKFKFQDDKYYRVESHVSRWDGENEISSTTYFKIENGKSVPINENEKSR